ncbi:hypothetical protein Y1Q_0008320 [Alligator mississippiensis]|uniref:Uncharacterized protein n=1 Tax=Alligator mississippiensis TaxID=8496 RepID=A0A151N1Q1_ALLMI|nr:hypothetical protein Y1Q_0008320 [Alligator mississippiensis]
MACAGSCPRPGKMLADVQNNKCKGAKSLSTQINSFCPYHSMQKKGLEDSSDNARRRKRRIRILNQGSLGWSSPLKGAIRCDQIN